MPHCRAVWTALAYKWKYWMIGHMNLGILLILQSCPAKWQYCPSLHSYQQRPRGCLPHVVTTTDTILCYLLLSDEWDMVSWCSSCVEDHSQDLASFPTLGGGCSVLSAPLLPLAGSPCWLLLVWTLGLCCSFSALSLSLFLAICQFFPPEVYSAQV